MPRNAPRTPLPAEQGQPKQQLVEMFQRTQIHDDAKVCRAGDSCTMACFGPGSDGTADHLHVCVGHPNPEQSHGMPTYERTCHVASKDDIAMATQAVQPSFHCLGGAAEVIGEIGVGTPAVMSQRQEQGVIPAVQ